MRNEECERKSAKGKVQNFISYFTFFMLHPGATAVAHYLPYVPFVMIVVYLLALLWVGRLGYVGHWRHTAADYFLASRTCGAFLLLMTIFGTTMTSFALVGSTGAASQRGIGIYGMMASWSGLIHSACFFLIGMKLWHLGKRFGYSTQIQFFRDRFQSPALAMILFPILVGLVIPYVLINILGSGATIEKVTAGTFPQWFAATAGGIPAWLGSAVVCLVVLIYVFGGGMRSLAFANGLHATVLVILGLTTLFLVVGKLGGPVAASERVAQVRPDLLVRGATAHAPAHMGHLEFLTYLFVPLSVGMFPHLFQHWMTARSAKTFRPVVLLHPLFIAIVWAPCMLMGIWAATAVINGHPGDSSRHPARRRAGDAGQEAHQPGGGRPVGRGHRLGHHVAGLAVPGPVQHVHARHPRATLRRAAHQRHAADLGRADAGAGGGGGGLRALAVCHEAQGSIYPLGVWCFSGFRRVVPAGLRLALLAAGDRGRRHRLDRGHGHRLGVALPRLALGRQRRTTCSWA